MTSVDDAQEVDPHDPVPVLELRVEEPSRQPNPRVVDQAVDRTGLAVDRLGESTHLIAVGDVDAAAGPDTTHAAHGRLVLGRPRLVDIADREVCAALGR